ncbi:MAG: enoyl-CoA hydratase/isomerase family protein [Alphaproteobacteria bacterium]|nr:enoyl-CoA hydratase/isomerase family protein [Alphaproteobacteria bacterium]
MELSSPTRGDRPLSVRPNADVSLECLTTAGLAGSDVAAWDRSKPRTTGGFAEDRGIFVRYWHLAESLVARLPKKAQRRAAEQAAADTIKQQARAARVQFLKAHGERLYDSLTHERSEFLRLDELARAASVAVPGLVPTPEQLKVENGLPLREKEGVEIDQGLFLSAVLAGERSGNHICHAMLLPHRETRELLPKFVKSGVLDLETASVTRKNHSAVVTVHNPRYLNAEDETTINAMEICVDIALLDPTTSVGVLRGGLVDHSKYKDRRVFGAGINLTHLYEGRIPYLWYLRRDLGFVHKLYRGLARPDSLPDDVTGDTIEKPWIAAVEAFAIGGHCQLLLTMDYVIAERDAFMTLPARKEGIIPGMANMRLPRLTGDRIARQAIQSERRLACDSPEGRLICDEIVDPGTMDTAIDRVVEGLSSSGVISAAANRRAFRVAQEPLDMFRSYCAVYARDQAFCHFSPALIANLERHWIAQHRNF